MSTPRDKFGNPLGSKDSALVPVNAGNPYNWNVSTNVGGPNVATCEVSFTAGLPPYVGPQLLDLSPDSRCPVRASRWSGQLQTRPPSVT